MALQLSRRIKGVDYPIEYLTEIREHKDDEFKNSPYSPLTPEQRALFQALNYYDANPALEFLISPTEFADKQMVRFLTTRNEIKFYQRWGQMRFTVDEQPITLTLFLEEGDTAFFVPFTDSTSGNETYGAGRYITPEQDPEGMLRLDFNEAYNPYCAYNEPPALAVSAKRQPRSWSCPLTPPENRLTIAIRAGEKKPVGGWVIDDEALPDASH